jgi:hypothetical protein
LLGSSISKFLVTVTGVDREEAAEPIDDLIALGVPEVVTLTTGNDGHVFGLVWRVAREVHPKVVFGASLEFFIAVSLAVTHRFEELEFSALARFGFLGLLLFDD